jgi:hypothetical protein
MFYGLFDYRLRGGIKDKGPRFYYSLQLTSLHQKTLKEEIQKI